MNPILLEDLTLETQDLLVGYFTGSGKTFPSVFLNFIYSAYQTLFSVP